MQNQDARVVHSLLPVVARWAEQDKGMLLLACAILGMQANAQTITQIIDATGDGHGNTLDEASGVAIDESGNAYVSGFASDNVFRITPEGIITEIIDESGDGRGNTLDRAVVVVEGRPEPGAPYRFESRPLPGRDWLERVFPPSPAEPEN